MSDEDEDQTLLSAEDVLTFGPVVEAQVWTPAFIAEARAPIAVAAGRPRLGKVFDDQGKGKAVLIRPCVSRGKRVRGLPPIYTPTMLEKHAAVFAGWPMYFDHMPPALTEAAAKRGRSVKELGGQVLTPYYDRDFTQEEDADFGYQQGGTLAEIWASPFLRNLVGENPGLLHTSIAAWPTSGKAGSAPWNGAVKGMVIEGIRRQPQGSVDFVPRGGAGGRLLLAESEDPDSRSWPEPGMEEEDVRFVVSLAESFYASPAMPEPTKNSTHAGLPDFSQMKPDELRGWLREHQPHLVPALAEVATPPAGAAAPAQTTPAIQALTEHDVRRMVDEAPSLSESDVAEMLETLIEQREEQRDLSALAVELIESAEGLPPSWKADLKARFAMTTSGPAHALAEAIESADDESDPEKLLREAVQKDLDRARDMIAEAQGKPRVTGEGGGSRSASGDERGKAAKKEAPYWRQRMADMGVVESAEDALSIHGVDKTKVEG